MKKKVLFVPLVSMLVIFGGCSSGSETKKSVENHEKSEEVAHEKKDEGHLDYDNQDTWEFTAGQVRHVSL